MVSKKKQPESYEDLEMVGKKLYEKEEGSYTMSH